MSSSRDVGILTGIAHHVTTTFNPWELPSNWSKETFYHLLNQSGEGVRKLLPVKRWSLSFTKPYHNWLNKWTFHDMNQSETILEGEPQRVHKLESWDRICHNSYLHATGANHSWVVKLDEIQHKGEKLNYTKSIMSIQMTIWHWITKYKVFFVHLV